MRDDEAVDSFASMFQAGFAAEPERITARRRAERRSSLTPKQRKRGAIRTAQINYRCTPAYKQLASGLARHFHVSIADVMEEALDLLAKAKKFRGEEQ
ncbi:hypothetical protein [Hyphomicrobium sp.]|uniref:hypothetical protein n=1 Tax=Hyphomicrobium sp. TaxID=82 RepID=UPI002D79FBCA|nr:hypothetical protein [Hyphomicrobium sp.]HET6388228.1 hypothetical protein [Hyphomicrobium sp.]